MMYPGMIKTYRLTYESVEVMHALFDRTSATQGWSISSRVLREYIEYFGPKTEQLDVVAQDRKAVFTSFTQKIQDGKGRVRPSLLGLLADNRSEVLKQPLETAIAIHTEDFEDFHMQEGMHIVISVKDFRAIVTHAETLKNPISASFSHPTRPLQFSYQNFGIHSEFTLMTTGDHRGTSSTPNPKFVSTRSSSRQPSVVPLQGKSRAASEMPPPARPSAGKPLSSQIQRPSLREQVRPASVATDDDPDPESLFVPNDGRDDDQTWDPPNYEQGEDDEMLGWDASNDNLGSMRPTIRDVNKARPPPRKVRDTGFSQDEGLEPTQRLSQVSMMLTAFNVSKFGIADSWAAAWHVRLSVHDAVGFGTVLLQCTAFIRDDETGRAAGKYG